jgi:hypothetical protein
MNYVKSLAKQLAVKGIRLNGVAADLSGRLCRSAVGRPSRSTGISAARQCLDVRHSRWSWPPSTYSWPQRTPALRPGISTERVADKASPEGDHPSPC